MSYRSRASLNKRRQEYLLAQCDSAYDAWEASGHRDNLRDMITEEMGDAARRRYFRLGARRLKPNRKEIKAITKHWGK